MKLTLLFGFLVTALTLVLLSPQPSVATVSLNETFVRCSNHAMCRELYRYSEFVTTDQFDRQARHHLSGATILLESPPVITLALNSNSEDVTDIAVWKAAAYELEMQLTIARLIIGKLALDPRRCPPNTYWYWNDDTNSSECNCYMDRDCTEAATVLCQDNLHGIILIVLIAVAVLIVVNIIIRMAYDPDLYKVKSV
jgi:hypothetical protein